MAMTLDQLAAYLRGHGVPTAEVGSTGGNCHSVVIPLRDGWEILVSDYEGPLSSGAEQVDGIMVTMYTDDGPATVESGPDGLLFASTPLATYGDAALDCAEQWAGWNAEADAAEAATIIRDTVADMYGSASFRGGQLVVEINSQSEAADAIGEALSDSTTYKITFAYDCGLKLKVNERIWSAPLKTDGYP